MTKQSPKHGPHDGNPTPQKWVDEPTLRLLPEERERFELEAKVSKANGKR